MLKIRTQFPAILIFDPKGCQGGCDGPQHDGVNIGAVEPLLFGKGFRDDGPDILVTQGAHRRIILATFSKPRLAK